MLDHKKISKGIDIILFLFSENILYFELVDILRSPEIVKVMTGTWTEELKKKENEREQKL